MKDFLTWLEALHPFRNQPTFQRMNPGYPTGPDLAPKRSITSDVIDKVLGYLQQNTYYDDPIDVQPIMRELGLNWQEIERIIGVIHQRMLKQPWDSGNGIYSFDPSTKMAHYSSEDI